MAAFKWIYLIVLLFLVISSLVPRSSPHRVITSIHDHDQQRTGHYRSNVGWEGGIQIDFPFPDGFASGGGISGEGGFQFDFYLPGFGTVVVSGGGSVNNGIKLPFPTFPLPGLPTHAVDPRHGDPFHCAPLSCIRGDALGCQLTYGVTQSFVQTEEHGGQYAAEPPHAAHN